MTWPALPPSVRLIVFDADGTVRECTTPGQPCPNDHDEWRLLPNVVDRLAAIDWRVTRAGIASNQMGIAKGFLGEDIARAMMEDMVAAAWAVPLAAGMFPVLSAAVKLCPHDAAGMCRCRKPAPGMLLDVMAVYSARPSETLFVGDMVTDKQAAAAAGCLFAWAKDFFAW